MFERIRPWLRSRLRLLLALLLGFTVAGFFGTAHRWLELVSHFRLQYLGCAVLGGTALLSVKDFRGSLLALVCFGINAAEILPWYVGKPVSAGPATPSLKLLLANVYTANQDSSRILELIAREQPDIVVLQEIDSRWVTRLSSLSTAYPASHIVARDDNFGIGLWMRLPAEIGQASLGEEAKPSLVARFRWQEKEVALLATHPLPPVDPVAFQLRNAQLAEVASWARAEKGACIVLGDLNLSVWSPYHARLLRESGLENARRGFGVLPTWPTQIPLMKIPLDHCLVNPAITVRAIRPGPQIGSDHLPLLVELGL